MVPYCHVGYWDGCWNCKTDLDESTPLLSFLHPFLLPLLLPPQVQEFMRFMEAAFARHPLWAGCSQEDIDAAVEVRGGRGEGRSRALPASLWRWKR